MSVNSKMTAIADAIRSLLGITGTLGLDAMATKLNGISKKTASDLSASGKTVTIPAGYYASQVTKDVGTATQATPSISVDSAGKITASANQSAGYVSAGTKTGTKQLTTQGAKTVTPGASEQTAVASGVYTTGAVKVAGDANLLPENIAEGVSIFGVAGAHAGGGEAVAQVVEITVYFQNATTTQSEVVTYFDSDGESQRIGMSPGTSRRVIYALHGMVFLNTVNTHNRYVQGDYALAGYMYMFRSDGGMVTYQGGASGGT